MDAEFFLVEGSYGSLIGTNTACDLDIQKRIESDVKLFRIEEQLKQVYPKVFEPKIGLLKGFEAELHVDDDVEPICQPLRPLSYHQRAAVDFELRRMIANDIIEPAVGPTTWCSSMVIVAKDNGDVRICSDGRPLKQALFREKHPPTTLADLKYKINGAKYFSKIDMRAGYYQLKLAKQSRIQKVYIVFHSFGSHVV